VADLKISRRGFSFDKNPNPASVENPKRVLTDSLNNFPHTLNLAYTVAPKPTHCP